MRLIDSHCHFDDDRYDGRRAALRAAARQVGVERLVVPATTANRWDKIRALCADDPGLYPAYGLHPWFVEQHQAAHLAELDEWLARETPVAVGECGLDFYRSRVDEDWQRQLFREQLRLAHGRRLPVIVHARKALDDVIALLRREPHHGGVVHSFAGSLQQARQLYELGFRVGIAATVAFERARKLRAVVAALPADALLLESDAPDQPGPAHRGEDNQPAFIVEHLRVIAELRDVPADELARQLNHNAASLFGIPP